MILFFFLQIYAVSITIRIVVGYELLAILFCFTDE